MLVLSHQKKRERKLNTTNFGEISSLNIDKQNQPEMHSAFLPYPVENDINQK
jgi:hypothetical protein